jgi:hypothetical protein
VQEDNEEREGKVPQDDREIHVLPLFFGPCHVCKKKRLSTWGRCFCDQNFLRFSTIFGKKFGIFLKNQ